MNTMTTKELVRTMMRFKPVTGDLECVNALVDFLAGYLESGGVHAEIHDCQGRKTLYAGPPGRAPRYLFNAHLDVVPAAAVMFEMREENGWLHGRGTHDCLGNCALLANLLVRLRGSDRLGVVFSTDEETGGETTRFMVRQGCRAERMIVVVDGSGNSLIVAQKGILSVKLVATGRACHAAEPWNGDNAIDRLIAGYVKIRDLFPPVVPPDEWHCTLAATTIAGGTVHNRVPDSADMVLNIRFTEERAPEEIISQLEKQSGLRVELLQDSPLVRCDAESREVRKLTACMATHLGCEIAIERSNGATDARHFVDLGLPIAIIGVPGKDLHGAGECLDSQALAAYEELLFAFLSGEST